MPFSSHAQRKFMYARHPEIAKRWRKESGPQRGLPAYSRKTPRQHMIRKFAKERRRGH